MAKDENGLHIQTPEEFEVQRQHILEEGDRKGDPDAVPVRPAWMLPLESEES